MIESMVLTCTRFHEWIKEVIMFSRTCSAILAGVFSAALAGCVSTGISSVAPIEPNNNDFEQFRSAARDGTVHTVIIGDAGSRERKQGVDVINSAFANKSTQVGHPASFSSDPKDKDIRNSRIVIVISPHENFGPSHMCEDDEKLAEASTAPESGKLKAIAAFCVGDGFRTWSIAQGPDQDAETDPLYQLAQQMAYDIIPNRASKAPGDCLNVC